MSTTSWELPLSSRLFSWRDLWLQGCGSAALEIENVHHALECANIVTASRDETEAVVSFCGQELGAIMAEHGIEQWLTTDGENGGWLLNRAGKRFDFRATPVDDIVDPTGAGDVFFAAYLTYHLYEGADVSAALHRAAALTARQVEGRFIAADELSRERD